jgi:hypothetical protein
LNLPRTEGGGDEKFIEKPERERRGAGGQGARAGGDDADEALGFVALDQAANVAFADAETRSAFRADERVLKRVRAEGAGAARWAKRFGKNALGRPRAEVENIETEL